MENLESEIEQIIIFLQKNKGHFKNMKLPIYDSVKDYWNEIEIKIHQYSLAVIFGDSIQLTQKGWEFESFEKYREKKITENEVIKGTIKTGKWTRNNMIISGILASITTMVVVKGCYDNRARDMQQRNRGLIDSIKQIQILQSVKEVNQKLQEISHALSDTAKVKVKIEK